ncbi:MAG: hypothetical protein MRY79_06465, partial [Alphaproteobacteria bacterium]|nr:hypothetical protein [Alphaproteobacteria bacterium]
NALGVDFSKETGGRRVVPGYLSGAWESAISMWPVENEKRVLEVYKDVRRMVDSAYSHNMK